MVFAPTDDLPPALCSNCHTQLGEDEQNGICFECDPVAAAYDPFDDDEKEGP